ncbi:Uncharacterised protein [Vibrio cholerae]|nr:Uncharacterised protein [Vibrio cholerae]CSI31294.1 Uncharacterised protein [Vibrio cholerae]
MVRGYPCRWGHQLVGVLNAILINRLHLLALIERIIDLNRMQNV